MRAAFDGLGPLLPFLPVRQDADVDDAAGGCRLRSVFISDLHLGTPGCQAAALLDFLKAHPVVQCAQRRGHHGVVCGHIHRAEMRVIDGVLYCNDGDWVESLTALVEHPDGRLELVSWAPPIHGRAGHAFKEHVE